MGLYQLHGDGTIWVCIQGRPCQDGSCSTTTPEQEQSSQQDCKDFGRIWDGLDSLCNISSKPIGAGQRLRAV